MSDWHITNNQLIKEFSFADFNQAIHFVNQVAQLAEEQNHHPNIFIHDYKKVRLALITHSTGTVTPKDHQLAKKIDALTQRSVEVSDDS